MHYDGLRLIQHAQSSRAHREGEVGVFVIGRRKAHIEAAELLEQGTRYRDRRAAQVVGVAQIVEPAVGRVFMASVVPAGTIGKHHAAGFLQAAVGIDQLGTDQAGIGMRLERAQQGIQPARLRHGVVVEEDQVLAARQSLRRRCTPR